MSFLFEPPKKTSKTETKKASDDTDMTASSTEQHASSSTHSHHSSPSTPSLSGLDAPTSFSAPTQFRPTGIGRQGLSDLIDHHIPDQGQDEPTQFFLQFIAQLKQVGDPDALLARMSQETALDHLLALQATGSIFEVESVQEDAPQQTHTHTETKSRAKSSSSTMSSEDLNDPIVPGPDQPYSKIWTRGTTGNAYANAQRHFQDHATVGGVTHTTVASYVAAAYKFTFGRGARDKFDMRKNFKTIYVTYDRQNRSGTLAIVDDRENRIASYYDINDSSARQHSYKDVVDQLATLSGLAPEEWQPQQQSSFLSLSSPSQPSQPSVTVSSTDSVMATSSSSVSVPAMKKWLKEDALVMNRSDAIKEINKLASSQPARAQQVFNYWNACFPSKAIDKSETQLS